MTSLVLGVVGAVIGTLIAPGIGTSIGFALGSAVGGYIDTVNTKINNVGPRLADRAVQVSSYGVDLPILFGTMRFAGTVAWSTDIQERQHDMHSGGKGSPQVNNTTFSYDAGFLVLLTDGEIVGIPEIWADNNLISSLSSDADVATLLSSVDFAHSVEVLRGTDTQMPPALIESYVGVGNCSGYRSRSGILFDQFQLANYGNRIPQITCKVVGAGAVAVTKHEFLSNLAISPEYATGVAWVSKDTIYVFRGFLGADFDGRLNVYKYTANVLEPEATNINIAPGYAVSHPAYVVNCQTNPFFSVQYYASGSYDDPQVLNIYDLLTGSIVASKQLKVGSQIYNIAFGYRTAYEESSGNLALAGTGSGRFYDQNVVYYIQGTEVFIPIPAGRIVLDICIYQEELYVLTLLSTQVYLSVFDDTGTLLYEWLGPMDASFGGTKLCVNEFGIFSWYEAAVANVHQYYATGAVLLCNDAGPPTGHFARAGMFWTNGQIGNFGLTDTNSYTEPAKAYTINFRGIAAADVLLKDIITALSARVSIQAGQIDVSTLTDVVHGYLITRQMPARSAIEFLLSAFHVDVVESGGITRYVKRGGAPVRTLTLADLGAHEYGSEPPDPISISRKQEVDLPRLVTLNYTDRDNAYQTGTVIAQRQNTVSEQTATLDVTALALSADEAARMVDVAMMEAWVTRDTFVFATTYAHEDLEPTDVVMLDDGGGVVYRVRITRRTDQGGLLNFEAVADDASLYDSTAVGSTPQIASGVISVASQTVMELLDVPIFRDADNNPGFYAALGAQNAAWHGATLFSSINGVTFDPVDSVSMSATIGKTQGTLPNYTGIAAFDDNSRVQVAITTYGTTLASATLDELLADPSKNAAVIGDEIVQFRTATLVTGNLWLLTGFFRGLRGTEGAIGAHVANERFVLIKKAGMLRVNFGAAEIGQSRSYKAISAGAKNGSVKSFTNTAVGLKPFRPVNLGFGTTSAGDGVFHFERRTRLQVNQVTEGPIPLGEASEKYEIDIAKDAAFTMVVRTITATSTTVPYPAALIAADRTAGLPVDFFWRAFQISGTVGRAGMVGSGSGGGGGGGSGSGSDGGASLPGEIIFDQSIVGGLQDGSTIVGTHFNNFTGSLIISFNAVTGAQLRYVNLPESISGRACNSLVVDSGYVYVVSNAVRLPSLVNKFLISNLGGIGDTVSSATTYYSAAPFSFSGLAKGVSSLWVAGVNQLLELSLSDLSLLQTVALSGSANNLYIDLVANHLFVCDSLNGQVSQFDLSSGTPTLIQNFATGYAGDCYVLGTTLFVAGTSRLLIYNITTGALKTFVYGDFQITAYGEKLFVSAGANRVAVASQFDGKVYIYDNFGVLRSTRMLKGAVIAGAFTGGYLLNDTNSGAEMTKKYDW